MPLKSGNACGNSSRWLVVEVFPVLVAVSAASYSFLAVLELKNGVYLPVRCPRRGLWLVEKVLGIEHQQTGYTHQQFLPVMPDRPVQHFSGEIRVFRVFRGFQTDTRSKFCNYGTTLVGL